MAAPHLLVVDDEEHLRSMLSAALAHHGFEVTPAEDGRSGVELASTVAPDLVVLDVMLPDLDGFEVCRRIRGAGNHTPVVFVTACGSTEEKVRGLSLGGDDYIEKPFSLEELVARVDAVLRRTRVEGRETHVHSCADLVLDVDAHRVTRAGEEVHLTPTEFTLLQFLLAHRGQVVSKAQILDHVWQYDFGGDGGIVETYIGYLRRKVDTVEPKLIHTIRGFGYTLRDA